MLPFVRRLDVRMVIWVILGLVTQLFAISVGCSSEPEVRTVEVIKEVPVEVIVEKEVPIQVVVEREIVKEVPVEVVVVKEIVKEVPVEVIVERVVVKEVPVEVVVEKEIVREVEVPTEVVKEVVKEIEEPVAATPTPATSSTSSEVTATPTPIDSVASRTIVDAGQWTQYLWTAGDRNVLYKTDTPNDPGSFRLENSLGGDFTYQEIVIRTVEADSTGTLWIVANNSLVRGELRLYRFDDNHPDNVVSVGALHFHYVYGPTSVPAAVGFDNQNHLWIVVEVREYSHWYLHEVEILPSGELIRTDHGRLSSEIESVNGMAFHESSLFIADDTLDRLFEVVDPRTPEVVVDRGLFPDDLGSADEIASDGVSLWIIDAQSGSTEFWRLEDVRSAGSAVEVGNINTVDGESIWRTRGLTFQTARLTEEEREDVPPTVEYMWLAAVGDVLYKLPEGDALSNIERVGGLEGRFVTELDIVSIDFDSQGHLYILARRDGSEGHKLYRLDNAANPRDAYVFSHLKGVGDALGQIRPIAVVVDAQDRVWVYDNDYTDAYLISDDGEQRLGPCPTDLNRCLVPDTFASGKGYASYPPWGILSLSDFTDPYSYAEVGQLPEEARGIRDITAGAQAFWGIVQEGIEQHLWRIPNIEVPGEAVKFGEFPERMPTFVDMAIYRTDKN